VIEEGEMKYLRVVLVSLATLAFVACNNNENDSDVRYVYVNHYKSECYSWALSLCMQTRDNENDEWSYFYDQIAGFEYEWGYAYKLKVKTEEIENPPADGSSKKYALMEVVEKTRELTDTLFEISASRAVGLVAKESDGVYRIYDKQFSCTVDQCQSVDSLIAQEFLMLLEFHHPSNLSDPLVLTQVKCGDAIESFHLSCQ
jgi:hypothetical protein